jgi:hypothetical protein
MKAGSVRSPFLEFFRIIVSADTVFTPLGTLGLLLLIWIFTFLSDGMSTEGRISEEGILIKDSISN